MYYRKYAERAKEVIKLTASTANGITISPPAIKVEYDNCEQRKVPVILIRCTGTGLCGCPATASQVVQLYEQG